MGKIDRKKRLLLTPHALVLLFLDSHGDKPLREVATAIYMTERAVQMIISELESEGYIARRKEGRVNRYTINHAQRIKLAFDSTATVGDFLAFVRDGKAITPPAPPGSKVTFTLR
jgi:hypothetical protein